MSSPETDLPVPAPSASNLSFVEDLYYEWLADPSAVDERWRGYFESLPSTPGTAPAPEAFAPRRPDGSAHAAPAATASADAAFQAKVDRLVTAYREYGHLRADLDPLALTRRAERLAPATFGLSEADLDRPCADPEGRRDLTLRELIARLEETYCRTLGVELAHMHDADLRGWLEQRMERTRNRVSLDARREEAAAREDRRGGDARAVPRDEVPRREALQRRGCRGPPAALRARGGPGDRPRGAQRRHRHGAPRPAERARERASASRSATSSPSSATPRS